MAEQNLLNPPSETYFLPTPPPMEEVAISDVSSSEDEGDDVSVKTADLTSAHLSEIELKALRRRMKKSHQWIPTTTCIKKELQARGRWPLKSIDKAAREERRLAKMERKRQLQLQRLRQERAAAARKAAAAQARAKKLTRRANHLKSKDSKKAQYSVPVAADEPTYCYCNEVSYGEMIACENEVAVAFLALLMNSLARESGFI